MIRRLHMVLKIPAEVLIREHVESAKRPRGSAIFARFTRFCASALMFAFDEIHTTTSSRFSSGLPIGGNRFTRAYELDLPAHHIAVGVQMQFPLKQLIEALADCAGRSDVVAPPISPGLAAVGGGAAGD